MKKTVVFMIIFCLLTQGTVMYFVSGLTGSAKDTRYYVGYDGTSDSFICNSEDLISVDGATYRKLQVSQDYYHGLTHGDVIFIDDEGYLVCDAVLLNKLTYIARMTEAYCWEGGDIAQFGQRIAQGSGIIVDVGNQLIEDTLSSVIINNFKAMFAACSGNVSDWALSYVDLIEGAGENVGAYLITMSSLYRLLMQANASIQDFSNYLSTIQSNKQGMNYEQSVKMEQMIRTCYADLMCCEYYISLIAEDVLGGHSNSSVDGLDVLITTAKSITDDTIKMGMEELLGGTVIDTLSTMSSMESAFKTVETALDIAVKRKEFYNAYYPGFLPLEDFWVEQLEINKIYDNVNQLTGIEYNNAIDNSQNGGYIATEFCATIDDGVYTIKNNDSNRMMNVYGGNNADTTNVVTWKFDGTVDQRFHIEHIGNGQYVIYAACSSDGEGGFMRCIDIYTGATNSLPSEGDNIDIYKRDTAWDLCQLFYIVPFEDGTVVFESCAVPGLVITADKPNSNNGNICVRDYNGSQSQFWRLCNTGGISYGDGFDNDYINIGDYAEDIVGVAQTQLGYMELDVTTEAPLFNGQGTWYTKYGYRFNNPAGAWCAFFVMWCAEQAGIPDTAIPQAQAYGKCSTMENWFRNNGLWQDANYEPWPGDIVFFDWENDGLPNHVGIVESVNADGSINTIEGNVCTNGLMQPAEQGYYQVATLTRSENIYGYGTPSFSFENIANAMAIDGGKTEGKAYMLPNASSETVWYVDDNDRCVVLCEDGDYYLLMYPFLNTGKYVAAYVPWDIISVFSESMVNIQTAEQFYSINKKVLLNEDTIVYHNPSTAPLMNGKADVRIRAELEQNTEVNVLFAYHSFYFVTTEDISGFVPMRNVNLNNVIEPDEPDISEPDVPEEEESDVPEAMPPSSEPEETVLIGDVDGDGVVTENDGILVLQYVAELIKLTDIQLGAADVDQNGIVNVADAARIFLY